jgi:hypothetical protein
MNNNQLGIQDLLKGTISFIESQFKIIFLSFVVGLFLSIIFHFNQKQYYETKAIAISGLSFYEQYENQTILDPLLAIEMINFLSEDIRQKNINELSELLNIPISLVENIKSIEAEGLFRTDADNRQYPISKFEVKLKVYDRNIVEKVEQGLLFYFTNNAHVKSYYEMYQKRNESIIDNIDEEISSLISTRSSQLHNADFSSLSISNNRSNNSVVQNQIIELYTQKQKHIKELALLKPLSFVKSFSKSEKPEDLLLSRVLIITFISLILGFIIGGVIELRKNNSVV